MCEGVSIKISKTAMYSQESFLLVLKTFGGVLYIDINLKTTVTTTSPKLSNARCKAISISNIKMLLFLLLCLFLDMKLRISIM